MLNKNTPWPLLTVAFGAALAAACTVTTTNTGGNGNGGAPPFDYGAGGSDVNGAAGNATAGAAGASTSPTFYVRLVNLVPEQSAIDVCYRVAGSTTSWAASAAVAGPIFAQQAVTNHAEFTFPAVSIYTAGSSNAALEYRVVPASSASCETAVDGWVDQSVAIGAGSFTVTFQGDSASGYKAIAYADPTVNAGTASLNVINALTQTGDVELVSFDTQSNPLDTLTGAIPQTSAQAIGVPAVALNLGIYHPTSAGSANATAVTEVMSFTPGADVSYSLFVAGTQVADAVELFHPVLIICPNDPEHETPTPGSLLVASGYCASSTRL